MLEDQITQLIAAAAGLGTASYALVDGSKAFGGGVSRNGFRYINRILTKCFPDDAGSAAELNSQGKRPGGGGVDNPLPLEDVRATLLANWLNGKAMAEQQEIAKTLIKLRLDENTAKSLAKATGVNGDKLQSIAGKIASGGTLEPDEQDVFGRFDLVLSAILDEGYQRADQAYRNCAKAWSIAVAVVLAVVGGWILEGASFGTHEFGMALLVGLAATPVAPVAKDLTSALSAGVKVAQLIRK